MSSLGRTEESGFALMVTVIALSLFSLLGMYVAFNATTGVRISDNYESEMQARAAALAGMSHSREVLRGINFSHLLVGPDGVYSSGSYLDQARTFAFRNPTSWATARTLDILNPAASFSGIPDDGVINTGRYGGTNGTALIPLTGISQSAANPYGSGTITTARYFAKAADNNGEATELARDGANNPFLDGDGLIILRSMGVAQTVREIAGGTARRNSVVVYEARFKHRGTFNLDAPLVVEGNNVLPSGPNMFDGNSFLIQGGTSNYGIGTIDVNTLDGISPSAEVTSHLAHNQDDNIAGLGPDPSVADITGIVSSDPDKALLLSPSYLWNFVNNLVPQFADYVYQGNQDWAGGSAPYIGAYDSTLPINGPGQDPKVTYVNGDLSVSGNMSGGGLLVVTGRFSCNGTFTYDGLILVVGAGDMDAGGLNRGVTGGVYIANVSMSGGAASFGTPRLSLSGNSNIYINSDTIMMAVGLIPPSQLSFREVTSSQDP